MLVKTICYGMMSWIMRMMSCKWIMRMMSIISRLSLWTSKVFLSKFLSTANWYYYQWKHRFDWFNSKVYSRARTKFAYHVCTWYVPSRYLVHTVMVWVVFGTIFKWNVVMVCTRYIPNGMLNLQTSRSPLLSSKIDHKQPKILKYGENHLWSE